jgi:hypothetical protein
MSGELKLLLAKQKLMQRFGCGDCGKIYSKYWDMVFEMNENKGYNFSSAGYSAPLQSVPDSNATALAEAEVYPQTGEDAIGGTP